MHIIIAMINLSASFINIVRLAITPEMKDIISTAWLIFIVVLLLLLLLLIKLLLFFLYLLRLSRAVSETSLQSWISIS